MKQIYRATIALFLCVCMALSLSSCGNNIGIQIQGKTYTFEEVYNIKINDEGKVNSWKNDFVTVTLTGYVTKKDGSPGSYRMFSDGFTERHDYTPDNYIKLGDKDSEGSYNWEEILFNVPETDYAKMELGDTVTITAHWGRATYVSINSPILIVDVVESIN